MTKYNVKIFSAEAIGQVIDLSIDKTVSSAGSSASDVI